MDRFDPSRAHVALAFSVIWANARLLAVVFLLSCLLWLVGVLGWLHWGEADPRTFAMYGVELVLRLSLDVPIGVAVLTTVASSGSLAGIDAVRATSAGRLALFFGGVLLLAFLGSLMWALLVAGAAYGMFAGWLAYTEALILMGLAMAMVFCLSNILFGLILPDILVTGRLSLGRALGRAWSRLGRLCLVLGLGVGPAYVLLLYLDGVFDTDVATPDERWQGGAGAEALNWDDALAALSRAGAGVLVSVLTFVALAKIHALVSPAEEDASQARVAEVFE